MKLVALSVILLGGCAGAMMNLDALRTQGYQRVRGGYVTATGELREPDYEVWWKETRDGERKGHFCVVPAPTLTSMGYNWAITVTIDDKEAWTYQSGPLEGRPSNRTGIDCTVSGPLPEGRLHLSTKLVFWH